MALLPTVQQMFHRAFDTVNNLLKVSVSGSGVAHDSPDTENPLPIGGTAETTVRAAVGDGDRVRAWFDQYGRLVIALKDTSGNAQDMTSTATNNSIGSKYAAWANAVAIARGSGGLEQLVSVNTGQLVTTLKNSSGAEPQISTFTGTVAGINGLVSWARGNRYSGSAWEVEYNNTQIEALASAARTADANTGVKTNYSGRGLLIVVDVTVYGGAGNIRPRLYTYYNSTLAEEIWQAGTAISGTGRYSYLVYPGAVAGTGSQITEISGIALPREWLLDMDHSTADSHTYSVYVHTIL